MKFAIDSFSFHLHFGMHWFKPTNPINLKWYCETCKKFGSDGLHIDPCHIDIKNDVEWLKEYTVQNNMYIELGGMGIDINKLKPQLLAAKTLNSPILRTFIGGNCAKGRNETHINAKKAKKKLIESVKLAEDLGIIIAIEDHLDVFLEDMLLLMEIDSPNLGVCYDSGNFMAVGEEPVNALNKLIDRVVCTHLKDMCSADTYNDAETFGLLNHQGHFCAVGDGLLPVEEIIDILHEKKGNDINLTLEIHTPYRTSLTEPKLLQFEFDNAHKSADYISRIINEKTF